jgi:ABC-2 type transport system permease protein
VQPDFRLYPNTGFGKPEAVAKGEGGSQPLAVAVTGSFDSLFAGKPQPQKEAKKDDQKGDDAGDSDRLIERSPPDARVVVVGSSSFVTDELLELSQRAGADHVANNLAMVQNMVDWAVADTDLLTIRSRGSQTRLLEVAPDSRGKWESINYAIVILALGIVVTMSALRRRTQVPLALEPRRQMGGGGEAGGKGGKGGKGAVTEKDEEERP